MDDDDDDDELARQTQADMRESLRLEGINDIDWFTLLMRGLLSWAKKLISQI